MFTTAMSGETVFVDPNAGVALALGIVLGILLVLSMGASIIVRSRHGRNSDIVRW